MNPQDPNLPKLVLAAKELGPLKDQVVFAGAAVLGLLITDDVIVEDLRATQDVDCVIELTTKEQWTRVSYQLVHALGFHADTRDGAPMCRFVKLELVLDVIPSSHNILGFGSRWLRACLKSPDMRILPNGTEISVIQPAYFLAAETTILQKAKTSRTSSHS